MTRPPEMIRAGALAAIGDDPYGPRLRDVARRDGPAPALAAWHAGLGTGVLGCGPGGHAVAPVRLATDASRVRVAGHPAQPGAVVATFTNAVLSTLDLAAVRCAPFGDLAPSGPDDGDPVWCRGLAWLRLGLCDRLLEAALAHLGERTFDGAPMLRQPLIKAQLADIVIVRLEVDAVLTGGRAGDDDLRVVHDRLTLAARSLIRLLGAAGFTIDGAGALGYVTELLDDVYCRPDGRGDDE